MRNKKKKESSKLEKFLLALTLLFGALLIVQAFSVSEFNFNFRGIEVPFLFIPNIIFLIYWLYKTKFYFLIPLSIVLLYISLSVAHNGIDDALQTTFNVIKSKKPDSADVLPEKDYIGKKVGEIAQHPRLLFDKENQKALTQSLAQNAQWAKISKIVREEGTILASSGYESSTKSAKHIDLNNSFMRLSYLSYCWRVTHDKQYLKAAEDYLLALSALPTWMPEKAGSYAETVAGVALAFDWLYNELPEAERLIIVKAIITKGLKPAQNTSFNGWLYETNERNLICNSAIIIGAIAVYDYDEGFCKQLINKSIASLSIGMSVYQPDGAYAGYKAATYALTFNGMAIDALRGAFKSDFDLLKNSGLVKAGHFLHNLIGTNGVEYAFGDGEVSVKLNPALYWLAENYNEPSLLWMPHFVQTHGTFEDFKNDKFLPVALIWGATAKNQQPKLPQTNLYLSNNKRAVALMRTSWTDNQAIYVGFKAGSPSNLYGHMDVGSFVVDQGGLRWVDDLGGENLSYMESLGINVADMSQNSRRWEIFRSSAKAHSIVTINSDDQIVGERANFVRNGDTPNLMYAIADLTKVYNKSVDKYFRGVSIVNKNAIVVRDEINLRSNGDIIRWSFATGAAITIVADNQLKLQGGGKTMYMKIISPLSVKLKTKPALPLHDYESRNTNKTLVGFDYSSTAKGPININVIFSADSTLLSIPALNLPLQQWGK